MTAPPLLQQCRWHPVADVAALRAEATRRTLDAAARAIRARGRFLVVLAGGDTPRGVYELLRTSGADWQHWHVYFGDERCGPPEDPLRNSRMAAGAWLDHVPIPPEQVHPMPAEHGAEGGAERYAAALAGVGEFDLVLLGLGEDGHTASLFPGQPLGDAPQAPEVLAVHGAPKPPPDRVSLGARRLGEAREVLFLVAGEGKREAVGRWRAGEDIPAAAIAPAAGVDIYLEKTLLPASAV
jgi:6-phosphogluconolactonase